MDEHFHFLRPWWLTALVPVAVIAIAWTRQKKISRIWRGIIAEALVEHLRVRPEGERGIRPFPLLIAAWVLAVLALAGPTWRREPSPFAEERAPLVGVIAVTPSMKVQDIPPSRLERGVQKLQDILKLRFGARSALVAYAGSAHLVMPLTRDARIIELFAEALDPQIMPEEGSVAIDALRLGAAQLREAGSGGSLLLIADEVPADQIAGLRQLRKEGLPPVSILAATTEAARLEPAADALDATLVPLAPDDRDVRRLAARCDRMEGTASSEEGGVRWRDMGYWLVPVVLLLALLAWRRGWSVQWSGIVLLVGIAGLGACSDSAGSASPAEGGWWLRSDQRTARLFAGGRFVDAARSAPDPMWRGAALYRAGEFREAAAAFAGRDTDVAHFNRGNALLMAGKYPQAVAAYDRALLLRPRWDAATVNRELARRRQAQREEAEPGEGTGGQLGADEILVDSGPQGASGSEEITEGGDAVEGAELRDLWLRRVQTRPADFLRARFAAQRAQARSAGEGR